MEAAEEEVLSMEENVFGNVRPVAYTGAPKWPAQTAGRARPSFGQHFGSDQRGIGSYKRSMEAAEEEVLTMGKSVSENARPPACTRPPRMLAQTAGYAGPSNALRVASDQAGIASYRMSVEAAEEEVQCMERNRSGNLRLVACTRPSKRPAQTAGHARPSDVLCFGSDHCGIGSCRRSMEAAEEQVQCMERSTSGNVRPAASTGPPERPTQAASHIGISMGTPRVVALVQDVTDPEATISESLGRSEEDTIGSPASIVEPAAKRQQRMDWQEKSRLPSKQQWQASFASGDQFVAHTTRHTTKGVVK